MSLLQRTFIYDFKSVKTNKKLPNGRFDKIDELFAFIAPQKDGEGVMGFLNEGVWIVMIGADMERVRSLTPIANMIANREGFKYEIRKFKRVTDE